MRKFILILSFSGILAGCSDKKHILDSYSTMRHEHLKIPVAAAGKDLLTVDFFSATQGVAGGVTGLILTTTDGGESWQDRSNTTLGDVYKLVFTSATTGWAGTSNGLYRTTSGGASWLRQDYNPIHDVQFVGRTDGYAVGTRNTILRTTDGGLSWQAQNPWNWFPVVDLHAVSFTSPDSGVAVGDQDAIYHTTNGGQTWRREYFGGLFTMRDVLRYRNGKGFVWVGEAYNSGYLNTGFKEVFPVPGSTTTSGWTINEAYPISSFTIYGLAHWQNQVVAVGNSTIIRQHKQYATHDSPWVQVLGPDGTTIQHNYRAADFSDANTFFAVGEKGIISRFHYN